MSHFKHLTDLLSEHGLIARGGFRPEPDDGVPGAAAEATLILVGNAGPAMWRAFAASPEYRDGAKDPLDRWTRRAVSAVAARFGARALFPFEGPPYHPFQRWAMKAEGLKPSPIGPLIHPVYGLWHAYRAALLIPRAMALPETVGQAHPCDGCVEKPCLGGCPVDAWHAGDGRPRERFDIETCVGHIAMPAGAACMDGGCRARRACPVGREYAYAPPQAAFHMAQFRAAQTARGLGAGRKSD